MKKFALVTTALLCAASLMAGTAFADSGYLQSIKDKGEITMLTATGFPPFEYLGDDGKPAGLDIDLGGLIAKELGVKLNILDMSFNLLIESLKSGKGDFIAAGMAVTEERKTQLDFSVLYANNGQTILAAKGSPIKTLDDLKTLKGNEIAVQESTTAHIFVTETLGVEPLAFLNVIECTNALKAGKVKVAIMNRVPAMMMAMIHPEVEFVNQPVTDHGTAMAVTKGHEDLLAVIDSVLKKAIEDGTIDALLDKHIKICAEG